MAVTREFMLWVIAPVHFVSGLGLAGGWVPSRGALCGVALSVSMHRAASLLHPQEVPYLFLDPFPVTLSLIVLIP